ncbi:MAG: hypothetical protein BroJett003_10150 [Planctomycetota bacterium]|nr:MAG: hypothetical protein BroJett003_10150 [Planctomycetota bacterium]
MRVCQAWAALTLGFTAASSLVFGQSDATGAISTADAAQTGVPPEELRQRIIELGRDEVDDAAFRREVERLIGEGIAPTGWVERVRGTLSNPWVIFGFAAQGVFMMRFVVQWIASERRKRSYVPIAFWWLSLAGGISLMTYAYHRRDPVFLFGQALGCVIYVRNLLLIRRRAEAHRDAVEERAVRSRASLDGDAMARDGAASLEVSGG